tara:strand:+ start:86 stop:367 length:282 start_codon:yes stop_codon:yes gene_type:complete
LKILERKKEWGSGSDRMSENFTYDRDWEQIHDALDKAERKQNWHMMKIQRKDTPKEDKVMHMRNYKGLEGVINALRWVLGDRKVTIKIVLGDE